MNCPHSIFQFGLERPLRFNFPFAINWYQDGFSDFDRSILVGDKTLRGRMPLRKAHGSYEEAEAYQPANSHRSALLWVRF